MCEWWLAHWGVRWRGVCRIGLFAGVPCEAGVVVAVMCERLLSHWCLRLACWVRVVRGAACLLGSAVVVVPEGWLCVSRGWHIVGAGGVAWWKCGLFAGLCSWRGVSVGVMCAWWLAHCRCWWVDGFGIGLFTGVPCEAGVVVAVMCERSLAHKGSVGRARSLCVSGGCHIARGFQSRVTLCEWWLTHCGRHGCRHGVPAVTLPLRLRRCARYEIRGGT